MNHVHCRPEYKLIMHTIAWNMLEPSSPGDILWRQSTITNVNMGYGYAWAFGKQASVHAWPMVRHDAHTSPYGMRSS